MSTFDFIYCKYNLQPLHKICRLVRQHLFVANLRYIQGVKVSICAKIPLSWN